MILSFKKMSPYCDKNYPTSKIDFNLMHVKSHAIYSQIFEWKKIEIHTLSVWFKKKNINN